jgi:hypothetical protein
MPILGDSPQLLGSALTSVCSFAFLSFRLRSILAGMQRYQRFQMRDWAAPGTVSAFIFLVSTTPLGVARHPRPVGAWRDSKVWGREWPSRDQAGGSNARLSTDQGSEAVKFGASG